MTTAQSRLEILLEAKDAASKVLNGLDKTVVGVGKSIDVLGKAARLAAVGGIAALGGGLLSAVGSAAKFEHAVDQVGAVANATEKEMKELSKTALRIGKDTAFSATEAAQAMEILAANGVSVTDIMGGAADATVALAAAGGTNLKMAADVASTSMTVWGIKTSEMTEVVNRLAGAANVSRFGVEDMALAVGQGGGAAASAGVEFADFATSIAATASSFNSGSDAGTSFKVFLNGLTPNAAPAKAALAELGIITKEAGNRFFDASGSLKSMADITQILNTATAGLTEQQKAQALETIFGQDAMRTAAALSKITGEEFTKMSEKMKNTDAQEVARVRMGNLKGAIEQLKGSMEVIAITIGTALLPKLTSLAGYVTNTALPAITELSRLFFLGFNGGAIGGEFSDVEKAAVKVGDYFKTTLVPAVTDMWAKFKIGMDEAIIPAVTGFFNFIIDHKVAMVIAMVAIGGAMLLALGPVAQLGAALLVIVTAIGYIKDNWADIQKVLSPGGNGGPDWLAPFKLKNPFPPIPFLPRAAGGPVSAGSPYMVGEKGPELFVPGMNGTIVPNQPRTGGGGVGGMAGATVIVNINGDNYGMDDLNRKVAEAWMAAYRGGAFYGTTVGASG